MKVLFLVRSSLYQNKGGDTVQVEETAAALRNLGVEVDVQLSNSRPRYAQYSLLHFFNCTRPQDFLSHVQASGKPYVLSTIYVDDARPSSVLQNLVGTSVTAYLKAWGRWAKNGEEIVSRQYLWLGHRRSIKKLLAGAAMLLPNSENEYRRLQQDFGIEKEYAVVYNGVSSLFQPHASRQRIVNKVICVGRIEPLKNQLALIRALNHTHYQVYIIGAASTNHTNYLQQCRKEAGANIHFTGALSQQELLQHYHTAGVHVLPSWFETTGLSTLEAAACGCQVVIGKYGDAQEYVGNAAWVCDPALPHSIRQAVDAAAATPISHELSAHVQQNFTWTKAAQRTLQVYQQVVQTA